jgi:ATP-dependent DNA helicase PIF1
MNYAREDLARIEANLNTAFAALSMASAQLKLLMADSVSPDQVSEWAKKFTSPKPGLSDPKAAILATPVPKIEIVKTPEPAKVEPAEELVINDEWRAALDSLHGRRGNQFITGGAGAGKTTLSTKFMREFDGVLAITAPTGVAALRAGGETIHRFFGFGIGITPDDVQTLNDSRQAKYKALDAALIDEVSMVRADIMDCIDKFMRLNGRDKNKPFGGCMMVLVGDPYQLPPVSKETEEKKWLMDRYGTDTPYFFHAQAWQNAPIKTHNLTTIFRQKDQAFTDALNAIRSGVVKPEHLDLINSRVQPGFRPPIDGDLWLTLTTTNNSADQANQRMLLSLPGPSETFNAVVADDFDLKNAPTDQTLNLRVGAAVMFIRNDSDKRWVNGTMGKVTKLNPLTVEVRGTEHEVQPETWEQITYEFDEKKKTLAKKVKGKFTQIPLKLAAAVTIHKSQGMSFDHAIIDFAYGAFAAGQAYVALSRLRTLEGMVLRKAVTEKDLITSPEVQSFMSGGTIARPVPVGQMGLGV